MPSVAIASILPVLAVTMTVPASMPKSPPVMMPVVVPLPVLLDTVAVPVAWMALPPVPFVCIRAGVARDGHVGRRVDRDAIGPCRFDPAVIGVYNDRSGVDAKTIGGDRREDGAGIRVAYGCGSCRMNCGPPRARCDNIGVVGNVGVRCVDAEKNADYSTDARLIMLPVTVASPLAWMAAPPALIRPPSLVTLTVVASMADEFPWMVPVLLLTVALFNAAIPVLVTDAISPELVTIASLALIEKLPEIVPAFSPCLCQKTNLRSLSPSRRPAL